MGNFAATVKQAFKTPEFDCLNGLARFSAESINWTMNATLTALNAFLLALNWQAEPGMTYTVQTSPDLATWETAPYVLSADSGELGLTFEALPSPVFARLRYNRNGDTNDNGLPDLWEWQVFGFVDVDALGDPDEDGASTYAEWISGTDPLDYYNGELPSIQLACGSDWLVRSGEISTQPVSLQITRASGEPWANAPVTLRLQSGDGGLLQSGDPPSAAVPELLAYADQLGRIHPELHGIHYLAPAIAGHQEALIIEAGEASAEIRVTVIAGGSGGPPRFLRREPVDADTVRYSWAGESTGALNFLIEEKNSEGSWAAVLELAGHEIPVPDPETGLHVLITEIPR
jgi:hypothetical protein